MVEEIRQKKIIQNNSFGTSVGELDKSGLLSEEEFSKLTNPSSDIKEDKEKNSKMIIDCFVSIRDRLKYYLDLNDDYYNIITLWIIGTHFHNQFPTFPYLFLNAMKGSGKTRLLKLIAKFSKGGDILNSVTEAVLFRENGTICIDEFEGVTRQGKDNLRELLNSCYKKGTKVKRMKKVKSSEGENQVVEEFELYRPIAMANIWGMEEVLGDRCFTLVLEKSNNEKITNLLEIFDYDEVIQNTLKQLKNLNQCMLCSVCAVEMVYKQWNTYIIDKHTLYTLPSLPTTTYTIYTTFDKIIESKISGRNLEICFPLLILAMEIDKSFFEIGMESENLFDNILNSLKKIVQERKEEDMMENKDILIYDFFSQQLETDSYQLTSDLLQKFKDFSQLTADYINARWFGQRLKTLNLIKKKRRESRGIFVIIDYKKAKEKMEMFR